MRLLRFTTRRLMAIVLTVAVLVDLGITLNRRRHRFAAQAAAHRINSENYMNRSRRYAVLEQYNRGMGLVDRDGSQIATAELFRHHAEGLTRMRDYYEQLERKYLRAARYPWLPVPPDPPAPD